ncbi:DUF3854 domain-containing protein [Synechococcus sp. BSF8S]|nr:MULTISPECIES: DUF3854 domain-containing protein [unclassified Synechococcus]MBC1260981.1 DUF3854 domain-containing protein [Synechococcus sp. BSF8S]MBC1263658.1 DUF3854 domain-containing protein [Synechococcus sp. BSA11S]
MATAEEAKAAVGVARPGWLVRFTALDGATPLTVNGPGSAPFVRFKPVPALEARNGTDPPKYLTAKGAGCRPYFSPFLSAEARKPNSRCDIDITEGEKKADAACAAGFPTIGLSGVDCWRDKRTGTSAMLPELAAINWNKRTVRIAFDSDIASKASVKSATRNLAFALTNLGAKVLITQIPCNIPDGPGNPTPSRWKNGLDDFIALAGVHSYSILRRLARPCVAKEKDPDTGKTELSWCWTPEPDREAVRDKALIAWTVFKSYCAVDPTRGLLHWVGTHWQALDGKPEDALAKPFLNWCDAMGWTRTGLGAVPKQLQAELRTTAGWDPPNLIAFPNGTLDAATGAFTPSHRRDDHITLCLPFHFDPGASCPRWHAFLNEALGGDQGLIELLRAAIRWTLEPKDSAQPFPAELCFDVFGPRGTGKGVLAEVLMGLLGGIGNGVARLDSASLDRPAALYQLLGKRLAIDPDASGHIANAGIFNAIVSNEPVTVKKLYCNEQTLRLGIVFWRFFNDDITVSGGGEEGMGRRIITFVFDRKPAKRDLALKAKLLSELAGIFAWVWNSNIGQAMHSLSNAAKHHEIAEAAISSAFSRNPIYSFLDELFPQGELIAVNSAFARWKGWCDDNNHKPGSIKSFSNNMAKVVGDSRRAGRRKVTTYQIPPMSTFDWAAHIGIAERDDTASTGDVDASQVDVEWTPWDTTRPSDPQGVDATATPSTSTQRPLNVHPPSTQNHCYDSLPTPVDAFSCLKNKGERQKANREQKGPPEGAPEQEEFSGPSNRVQASTCPQETTNSGGGGPVSGGDAAPVHTVSDQVEAALHQARTGPLHPSAARIAHDALKDSGISKNQIDLALERLRQEERSDQGELL